MLDSVPYSFLIPVAVLMALAPFFPKPHLVEKIQMLFQGDLRRPIDIFDLFFHAAPAVLVALKWITSR